MRPYFLIGLCLQKSQFLRSAGLTATRVCHYNSQMPLTIRVEFNILRFEAPAAHDPAAERLIMGTSAVAPEFGVAAPAVMILAEVCHNASTKTAKRIKTRIRARNQGRGRLAPNAASTRARETPEPWLPATAFPNNMLDALWPLPRRNELISWSAGRQTDPHDPIISPARQAAENVFRHGAAFPGDHPTLVNLLLAAHSEAPTLAVCDGVVCVPREDVIFYTSPADPRSAGSLVCKTSRNRSDSHQRWPRADVPAKEQALLRSENLSPLVIVASDDVEPFWTLQSEDRVRRQSSRWARRERKAAGSSGFDVTKMMVSHDVAGWDGGARLPSASDGILEKNVIAALAPRDRLTEHAFAMALSNFNRLMNVLPSRSDRQNFVRLAPRSGHKLRIAGAAVGSGPKPGNYLPWRETRPFWAAGSFLAQQYGALLNLGSRSAMANWQFRTLWWGRLWYLP